MEGEDWRSRIPPGFKFIPRDDELLLFYLMPKLMGQSLPCGIVTEAEVYKHHAQKLLGTNHEAYFFTSRNRKYRNGTLPDRKAGAGFWKASSTIKDIKTPDNLVIGQKRTLVYYANEETPKGRKTDWLMIEYTIPCFQLSLQDEKLDTWVLCKVYLKNQEKSTNDGAVFEDQAIASSSHFIVHEDTKGPIEIDSSQHDMVTDRQVQVLLDCSNHIEEQACMQSNSWCANRDTSPCMVMLSNVPLQLVADTVQCSPSRLGQGPTNSQPHVTLPPPPPTSTCMLNNLKKKELREAKVMEGEDWRLRIPPGFRFIPTDDELLLFYLVPKLTSQPLPCGIVTEDEVYKHHPQELLGANHEAYFFTSRNRKYPNGNRPDRKAGDGFWKTTTSNKEIKALDNSVIGYKRTLVYFIYDGTPKGKKTNWLMVEYTIPHSQLPLQDKQLDTWVICKVYLNNRGKNTDGGGAIYEDQAIGSSSHLIVNDDTVGPIEVYSLQQDMVTSMRARVMLDCSNHIEERACMQSSPSCANRDMSPCMEMPSYVPPQSIAYTVGCSPSRLCQDPLDSQPPMALPPPPPPAFTGWAEVGPSTSHASLVVPTLTPQQDFSSPTLPFTGYAEVGPSTSYDSMEVSASTLPLGFSNILPRPFDSNLPDVSEILEGIEADPNTKYFYYVEAKLKEVLGDSWLEEI